MTRTREIGCLANSISPTHDTSAWPDTQNNALDSRHPAQPWPRPAFGRMGPQRQGLGSFRSRAHPELGGPPQGDCQRCFQTQCRRLWAAQGRPGCLQFHSDISMVQSLSGTLRFCRRGYGWGKTLDPPLQRNCGEKARKSRLFQRRRGPCSRERGRGSRDSAGAGLGRALAEATGGSGFLLGWEQRLRLSLVRTGHLPRQGGFLRLHH